MTHSKQGKVLLTGIDKNGKNAPRWHNASEGNEAKDCNATASADLTTGFEMIRSDEHDAVREAFASDQASAVEATKSEGVVPKRMLSYLENQVDGINVAARKMGLPEYTLTIGESFYEERRGHGSRYVNVTIEGEPPKTPSDHVFLGVLKHDPDGAPNQVYGDLAPLTLEQFRDSPGTRCDACGVKHDRHTSVIVGSPETGEVSQVGGSCMRTHLGMHKSPDQIVKYAEMQADFKASFNDLFATGMEELDHLDASSGWMNSSHRDARIRRPLDTVVAALVVQKRTNGVAQAHDRTANEIKVRNQIFNNWHPDRGTDELAFTDSDRQEAQDVIGWVNNLSDENLEKSSVLRNVKAAFTDPESQVSNFNLHLIAVAVSSKERHDREDRQAAIDKERKDRKEQQRLAGPDPERKSVHIGNIGERNEHTAEVVETKKKTFTDYRGTVEKTSLLLRDGDGNLIRAMKSKSFAPEKGDTLTFKATVRDHSYGRHGMKITDVSRPATPKTK